MKKTILILIILSLPLAALAGEANLSAKDSAQLYTVSRVIDACTIELANGEKVRLIGVEIPDSMKDKAAEFTKDLVKGKQVRLEYGVQQRDEYGRLLAYTFIFNCKNCKILAISGHEHIDLDDGKYLFVNATLVSLGYARVMTVPPNVKYLDLFLKLEKEAKENKRGLWKSGI